ncbi:hypothetical protein BDR05DRAFT_1005615 [Suillus weaverae]|nr:hypothetical protein BDR05DRAFT_1005615 [Suillus weaverae]
MEQDTNSTSRQGSPAPSLRDDLPEPDLNLPELDIDRSDPPEPDFNPPGPDLDPLEPNFDPPGPDFNSGARLPSSTTPTRPTSQPTAATTQ